MKAAISNAVTTFAQAAERGAWHDRDTATIERQQRRIAELESLLHAADNRLTVAEGGLQLIGEAIRLPGDTPIPEVIEAALGRLR